MFRQAKLYFFTLTSLKREQIFYRVAYSIKRKFLKNRLVTPKQEIKGLPKLVFDSGIYSQFSYSKPSTFTFLNSTKKFEDNIDWNAAGETKLWNYNLNYFEFLLQKDLSEKEGLALIHDYIKNINNVENGLDAYPTSLRLINWIKFLAIHKIDDPEASKYINSQAIHLSSNIEFHVLGNHLLENGFGLLFSSFYLRSPRMLRLAESLIIRELKEEILPDGGHFERSVMYHQIILFRILDSLNLILNNKWEVISESFIQILKEKAKMMLAWLDNITFTNNFQPLFNDSAVGVAPTYLDLLLYAKRLNLSWDPIPLTSSGYRYFKKKNYEICLDIGEIGPSYVPGHAHSDTFSFIMNIKKTPFIVDTGTSTYENSSRRIYERSTEAHNTVTIGKQDQSEVWSSFRVGRKAHIIQLQEEENYVKATHNGYKRLGNILHTREFSLGDSSIKISDKIQNSFQAQPCTAYFHVHGDVKLEETRESEIFFSHPNYNGKIELNKAQSIKISSQKASLEFNKFYPINRIEVSFEEKLTTTIHIL